MPNGITGSISDGPLTRAESALIAGNGTPSHDIAPRLRYFPGPQHGRWRAGLSTDRLTSAVPSSALFTFRDGKMGTVAAFTAGTFTRSTRNLDISGTAEAGAFAGLTWTPDMYVCIQERQSGWVPGVYGVDEIVDDDNVILAGAPTDNSVSDGSVAWGGTTINLTDATWTAATYRLEKTGAFASYTWDSEDTYTPTSADGGWFFLSPYTRSYLIRRKISDDVIELVPFGSLPADNAGATGYLGVGLYAEPYVPIGAPTGATGGQNQFNIPAVTQAESFAINQSKYWDYSTDLPPGGLAGGAVAKWSFGGRAKFAYLTSRPTNDSDGDGRYDQTGSTSVVLTLDPWSSPFVSFIKGHSEGVYRETRKSRLGWTPDAIGEIGTFEDDGSGGLRIVFPSRHSATVTDGTLVYVHAADIADTLPDELIEGQGYYVDSLSGGNAGKFALYHDKLLRTKVSSAGDLSAGVTMSRGSQGSLYQLTFQFSIPATQVVMRDAFCDATRIASDGTAALNATADWTDMTYTGSSGVGTLDVQFDTTALLSAPWKVGDLVAISGAPEPPDISEDINSAADTGYLVTAIDYSTGVVTLAVSLAGDPWTSGTDLSTAISPDPVTGAIRRVAELGNTIEHADLAQRSVGDRLFCIATGSAGFTVNTDYWIISKQTTTTAVLSASEGGAAFDITADSLSASFLWSDPARLSPDDYMRCEGEVIAEADATSDNDETGVRFRASMRITPFGESVGGFAVGASSSRDSEVRTVSVSRTLPGKTNSFTGTAIATGAPLVLAKADYYTDGTYSFDAFVSTKFDYGGDYDILHLNGRLYYASLATAGEYSYPLVSVQGGDVDGQSSSYRRATNTLVYRVGETSPVGEVIFHDDARQLCAVRMLDEGEHFCRDDALEFRTYRYVRTTSFSGVAWDPTAKTLIKTNAFTNLTFAAGVKIAISSLASSNPNIVQTHVAGFTPGVYEVASKDSNSQLTLVSAVGLPTAAFTAAQGGLGGHFRNDAATGGNNWGFDPAPVQVLTTIKGPKFDTAAYTFADGKITETGAFADWTFYSGASVYMTAGGSVSAPAFTIPGSYTVTAADADSITLSGGPAANKTGVRGQLETNIPISPVIVDIGPQMIRMAVRAAVTGPPDGSCELEINTYNVELLDAGSR